MDFYDRYQDKPWNTGGSKKISINYGHKKKSKNWGEKQDPAEVEVLKEIMARFDIRLPLEAFTRPRPMGSHSGGGSGVGAPLAVASSCQEIGTIQKGINQLNLSMKTSFAIEEEGDKENEVNEASDGHEGQPVALVPE